MKITGIITSIQSTTEAVKILSERIREFNDFHLIVVGDEKSPFTYSEEVEFITYQEQLSLNYGIIDFLPANNYARKNIGYLIAMERKSETIYETDDDNYPVDDTWGPYEKEQDIMQISDTRWFNVYSHFTTNKIWPRGLPLNQLNKITYKTIDKHPIQSYIQQEIVNGSPDVDAIWRFTEDKTFTFDNSSSIAMHKGTFCPFNSQNTWWFPEAYPLMYLPSYCSIRMTDIWRSFIAQRCLWEMNSRVTFHAPKVKQNRNLHNLNKDFEDEVPGYLMNEKIIEILYELPLQQGEELKITRDNLKICYQALIDSDIFSYNEMDLLCLWLDDVQKILS